MTADAKVPGADLAEQVQNSLRLRKTYTLIAGSVRDPLGALNPSLAKRSLIGRADAVSDE